jgi:hypothetical protein
VAKFVEAVDKGEFGEIWEDVICFDVVDGDEPRFTIDMDNGNYKIVVNKGWTWKRMLSSIRDQLKTYHYFFDTMSTVLYTCSPSRSWYYNSVKICDETVTVKMEHIRLQDADGNYRKATFKMTLDELKDTCATGVLQPHLRKQFLAALVFQQECPICQSSNIHIMHGCSTCHNDVCLSCTVKSIRHTGRLCCPFCREIEDDDEFDFGPAYLVSDLLNDYGVGKKEASST